MTLGHTILASALLLGMLLLGCAFVLARRRLFHWSNAGFWTVVSLMLYLCVNPAISVLSGGTALRTYTERLRYTEQTTRVWWITLVCIAGVVSLFVSYLHTKVKPIRWRLRPGARLNHLAIVPLIAFSAFGIYSLIMFRVRTDAALADRVLNGRHVGTITGYQAVAHLFLFVPAILLIVSSRRWAFIGWLLGLSYVVLGSMDAWTRFTVVSMLIAMSLAQVRCARRRWPSAAIISLALVTAIALQARGHHRFGEQQDAVDVVASVPEHVTSSLASLDTAMQANFYLQSYLIDNVYGYDYGIPLTNYVLTGWLPNRFFPWKYFLVDWLNSERRSLKELRLDDLLYGNKPGMLGSFYQEGGIVGVILLMALMGFLLRKLEGMLHPDSPALVQATGICWMSLLWIIWGSHDFWAVSNAGSVAIPAIVAWLALPHYWKHSRVRAKRYAELARYSADYVGVVSQVDATPGS